MTDRYINFNDFKKKGLKPEDYLLPAEVAILLTTTSENSLMANQDYSIELKKSWWSWSKTKFENKFSHNLLRNNNPKVKEWFVVEPSSKGKGGFGTVNMAKLMIVIEGSTARVVSVEKVVKAQTIDKNDDRQEKIRSVFKEAAHQERHSVIVDSVTVDKNQIFTVTEDCGTSLDKLLPFQPASNFNFDKRLAIAASIANELLLLKQKKTVHRDLKPANICYAEKGRYVSTKLIDFGLADNVDGKLNLDTSGTPCYMAPEIMRSGTSHASDMYAFAGILAEIFNATNVLKNKKETPVHFVGYQPLFETNFCLDGIFTGFDIPKDIDEQLLDDFKALIIKLQDNDPKKRPTIEMVNKFITGIPVRRQQYETYCSSWDQMELMYKQLAKSYISLGLVETPHQPPKPKHKQPELKNKHNVFLNNIWQNQNTLLQKFSSLPQAKSHLGLSEKLAATNKSVRELEDNHQYHAFPIAELNRITSEIKKQQQYLDSFNRTMGDLSKHFVVDSRKFKSTNSTGIIRIQHILQSNGSPLEKMERINKIASAKIQPGFFNWLSKSHVFGKGRHENVDKLYHRIAGVSSKCSADDRIANAALEEINQFISNNQFTY